MFETQSWKHVFKLDPDKSLTDIDLEAVCESGTDAILVGGTYGVTFDNTIELLGRVRRYAVPCVLEVSNQAAIVPGFDHYFIPFVMNAMAPEWIIEPHVQAVKELGTMIPWDDVSMIGYCVLHGESGVAKLTRSRTNLHRDDVIAYGRMAHHLLRLPYFYLEYSGTFGDIDLVRDVYQTLKRECGMHIFYGGGIRSKHDVREMMPFADTMVVGNIIYDDLQAAVETVKEVKGS